MMCQTLLNYSGLEWLTEVINIEDKEANNYPKVLG
jgi:hypothetical protein